MIGLADSVGNALQQIRSRPLLSSDRPAEFGDDKSCLDRSAECATRDRSPLACQFAIGPLDSIDVARNFNSDPLTRQRLRKIALDRTAVGIEPHQRIDVL